MINISNVYGGLKKEIHILAMVRFVNCLGYFVIPFLSLYMTSTLSVEIAISGLIIGIINLLAIPSGLIGGKLSSLYDSKKVVIILQVLSALSYICVIFSKYSVLKIIFASIGVCFSNAVTPAFDECVGRVDSDQKKSFALMYFVQNLGFGLGSLAIGVLYKINVDYVFLGDAISTVISVLILYCFIGSQEDNMSKGFNVSKKKTDKIFKLDRTFKKKEFFFVVALNSLSYGEVTFILPLYLKSFLNENYAILYGLLMTVNTILVIILSPIATKIISKVKLVHVIRYSLIIFIFGYLMYAISENTICLFIATVLWSIGEVLFSISQMPYLIEGQNRDKIAYLSSISNSFEKAGNILSSVIGGVLVYIVGYRYVWLFISGITIVSFAIMQYLSIKERKIIYE